MEMSWKALLYDWSGANQALFLVLNQGLPHTLARFAWFGSTLGSYWGAPMIFTALGWWAQRTDQPGATQRITLQMQRFALTCLFAFVLAGMVKWALDFPRPPAVLGAAAHVIGEAESHHSFPSGHSVYAALLVGTLWPLVPSSLRGALVGFLVWVGWSRIAAGAHFPADVVAGWVLGFVCVRIARHFVQAEANPKLRRRFRDASNDRLRAAASAYRAGDLNLAFQLMREAHVPGQCYFSMRWHSHVLMLRISMARRDLRGMAGQLGRLLVIPFAHLAERLSAGNAGEANVLGLARVPIHGDLQSIRTYQATDMHSQHPLKTAPSLQSTGFGWWTLALLVAIADQTTKYAVHTGLPYGASIPITDFFNFVHWLNAGAAFSFLADAGGWQRYFFSILALAVSAVLAWMLRKPLPKNEAFGYSFILGGALGNVADRFVRGYVVDFLDFHWQTWHWPAFNLADIGICVGAALLVIGAFRASGKQSLSPD